MTWAYKQNLMTYEIATTYQWNPFQSVKKRAAQKLVMDKPVCFENKSLFWTYFVLYIFAFICLFSESPHFLSTTGYKYLNCPYTSKLPIYNTSKCQHSYMLPPSVNSIVYIFKTLFCCNYYFFTILYFHSLMTGLS